MIMPLNGERRPQNLIATRFQERNAELSPNGRWLAYQSTKSGGRDEVYVAPFPDVDKGEWQMSSTGGSRPAWASDNELLYLTSESNTARLMSVAVKESNGALERLTPVKAVDLDPLPLTLPGRACDVYRGGQRIVAVKALPAMDSEPEALRGMIVVQNWLEELKRRVPAR